jgi:hypothetical protein
MKAYGGVDVYIHTFLTSALAGGEWSASRPTLSVHTIIFPKIPHVQFYVGLWFAYISVS